MSTSQYLHVRDLWSISSKLGAISLLGQDLWHLITWSLPIATTLEWSCTAAHCHNPRLIACRRPLPEYMPTDYRCTVTDEYRPAGDGQRTIMDENGPVGNRRCTVTVGEIRPPVTDNAPLWMKVRPLAKNNAPLRMKIGPPATDNAPLQMKIGLVTDSSPLRMKIGLPVMNNAPLQTKIGPPATDNAQLRTKIGPPATDNDRNERI